MVQKSQCTKCDVESHNNKCITKKWGGPKNTHNLTYIYDAIPQITCFHSIDIPRLFHLPFLGHEFIISLSNQDLEVPESYLVYFKEFADCSLSFYLDIQNRQTEYKHHRSKVAYIDIPQSCLNYHLAYNSTVQ